MILEALFRGGIFPQEQVRPETQTYSDSTARIEELTDKLKERLNPDEWGLLEKWKQNISIADCEEEEELFCYGLTVGILLMCEVREVAGRYLDS